MGHQGMLIWMTKSPPSAKKATLPTKDGGNALLLGENKHPMNQKTEGRKFFKTMECRKEQWRYPFHPPHCLLSQREENRKDRIKQQVLENAEKRSLIRGFQEYSLELAGAWSLDFRPLNNFLYPMSEDQSLVLVSLKSLGIWMWSSLWLILDS